ncbi:MAG: hypothetical protein IT196_23435 [Acidimicrobiales bacterium]|nr:hypothetical protein [Acidimicrobiales bacterium]
MVDTLARTGAWADAWAGTPEQLAARYAADASLLLVTEEGRTVVEGRAAITEHAAAGLFRVPDRAVIAQRILAGGDPTDGAEHLITEWLFTGRAAEDLVTMAAPGLTWWTLDAAGLIRTELRVVAWSERRILDDEVRRARPLADGEERSHGWYRDFVARLFEVVAFDPGLARVSSCADDATASDLAGAGRADSSGQAAAMASAGAVLGVRGTFAVRLDDAAGPFAVVVADLDGADRIVHEQRYGGRWWPAADPA